MQLNVIGHELALLHREIPERIENSILGYIPTINSFNGTSLDKESLLNISIRSNEADVFSEIYEQMVHYIDESSLVDKEYWMLPIYALSPQLSDEESRHSYRLIRLLHLGIAYLELYCQVNYTGPELEILKRKDILREFYESYEDQKKVILQHLECDGLYPYAAVDLPHLLLIARVILSFVCDYKKGSWKRGVQLDEDGGISLPLHPIEFLTEEQQCKILSQKPLISAPWWHARAVVLHVRLLQSQRYENCPFLWRDAQISFANVLETFCCVPPGAPVLYDNISETVRNAAALVGLSDSVPAMLVAKAFIEWGLANHYFCHGDKGRKCFAAAKAAIGLNAGLTAALGKRTKYQRQDIAQLVIFAESSLGNSDTPNGTLERSRSLPIQLVDEKKTDADALDNNEEKSESGWQHGEYELGKRLVKEAEGGEEVAVREVLLDSVDGGPNENIIIEGGPRFVESQESASGGSLHPLDQCVLLALCLDVSNSNPADGLTNEEMLPYVERVLQQAKNWMIHSTSLLQRSWLEFERRKTADRAMLQIQALIDQHSTKLTITQATYKSIEESAPVEERMRYLYQIVYPSLFELKRDLAYKYMQCQVFMSALGYLKELELWDEVVTCYQLMQKPHRAELVVREQLKIGETPYMLTSLADLTGKEDLYERAWVLSQRRFARAKRTLAKICFDRGEFAACCEHLDCALSVQPLVHTSWYLKGIACMRIENWEEGLSAFVRCVQQDPEVGEAWANMGAIHMRMKNWAKAHNVLTEALKHKTDNWRVLENLLAVTLSMSRWKEAVRHMSKLVDLRSKSNRPLHISELRHVSKVAASLARAERDAELCQGEEVNIEGLSADSNKDANMSAPAVRSEVKDMISSLPELARQVESLFEIITSTLKSEPDVWAIIAEFQHELGRYRLAYDARIKQYRALITEVDWMKDKEKVEVLIQSSDILLDSLSFEEAKKPDAYQVKMLFQGTQKKMEGYEGAEQGHKDAFKRLTEAVDAKMRSIQGSQ